MQDALTSVDDRPVSPHDCLLVVAIPLGREEFIRDLNPARRVDFVKHFSRGRERLSPGGLWNLYQPYANLALDVIREAKDRGVEVICGSTLRDFSINLLRKEVTTLVAHWRSPLFRVSDVAGAVRRSEEIDERLRSVVGFSCIGLDAEEFAAKLNDYLNNGISSNAVRDNARVGALTRKLSALQDRRRRLEQEIPKVFEGGSSVEFADGLFALDQVVAGVAAEFRGILDLTVCNSVLLGDAVRKKCDHSVVLVNEKTASLDFRFAVYRQIIRSLARTPQSFINLVLDFRTRLTKVLA